MGLLPHFGYITNSCCMCPHHASRKTFSCCLDGIPEQTEALSSFLLPVQLIAVCCILALNMVYKITSGNPLYICGGSVLPADIGYTDIYIDDNRFLPAHRCCDEIRTKYVYLAFPAGSANGKMHLLQMICCPSCVFLPRRWSGQFRYLSDLEQTGGIVRWVRQTPSPPVHSSCILRLLPPK